MSTRNQIEDFIKNEFLVREDQTLPQFDGPLLSSAGGVVDSVGLQKLIAHLEGHLEIVVDDLDIVPENFASIKNVVEFVEGKLAKGPTE